MCNSNFKNNFLQIKFDYLLKHCLWAFKNKIYIILVCLWLEKLFYRIKMNAHRIAFQNRRLEHNIFT